MRWNATIPTFVLLGIALTSTAQAGDDIDGAEMRSEMHRFFENDKAHAHLLFGVGVSTIGLGAVLATEPGVPRATAVPLAGIGLLQAIVGGGIYLRTDKQLAELDNQLTNDPAALREAEYKRMSRLHIQYTIAQFAEASMIVGGGLVLNNGLRKDSDRWKGIGLGLLIQGLLTLPLDIMADDGGERYRNSLAKFTVRMAALPESGRHGLNALIVERRF